MTIVAIDNFTDWGKLQLGTLTFGGILKGIRELRGQSVRHAAKLAAMDPGNYSRLETGYTPPPATKAGVLSMARRLAITDDGNIETLLAAARKHHVDRVYEKFE
jgi:transcriptional regulator with XRE-family HTH domain